MNWLKLHIMDNQKNIITLVFWYLLINITACSQHPAGTKPNNTVDLRQTPDNLQFDAVSNNDSVSLHKIKLNKIYTQSISEFIKAVYKKDKISFDTLYFGKHVYGQDDDWPDVQLPKKIEDTEVILISPELGLELQKIRNSVIYINLIGWVDKQKAEFVFVVFSNGRQHQYDYFVDFTYLASQQTFVLDKIYFEDYLSIKDKKPVRLPIYINGKYTVSVLKH